MRFDVTQHGDRSVLISRLTSTTNDADRETFDVTRLPWQDESTMALEVDDVPAPSQWPLAVPAFTEWRRVLDSGGLLEFRTRADVGACTGRLGCGPESVAPQFAQILGELGFEIVMLEPSHDDPSRLEGVALRGDIPFGAVATPVTDASAPIADLSWHGPFLHNRPSGSLGRAVVLALDEAGMKVRVHPTFEILDDRYGD